MSCCFSSLQHFPFHFLHSMEAVVIQFSLIFFCFSTAFYGSKKRVLMIQHVQWYQAGQYKKGRCDGTKLDFILFLGPQRLARRDRTQRRWCLAFFSYLSHHHSTLFRRMEPAFQLRGQNQNFEDPDLDDYKPNFSCLQIWFSLCQLCQVVSLNASIVVCSWPSAVGWTLDMIIRVTKHSSLVIHHRLYLALARSFVTSQVLPNWAGSGHRRVQLTAAEERWTSDDWPWPRTIWEQ